MFKLPIKQAVLNGNSSVNAYAAADANFATPIAAADISAGDKVVIDGYGTFTVPAIAAGAADPNNANITLGGSGFSAVATDAVAGVYTITPPPTASLVAGDVWDLNLTFTQGPRTLSEIWSYGEKRTFQSKPLGGTEATDWVTAFKDALTQVNKEYFGTENVLEFSGSTTLVVTFKAGYEGIGIKMARANESLGEVTSDVILVMDETTVPSEGVNTGKQIEAEVRNATFDNIDPYGIQFGGNAQGVDVRGKYTEIHWTSAAPLNGFEPHAMTGYGDANTETNHAATEYSIFANEASAADSIVILSKLTGYKNEAT